MHHGRMTAGSSIAERLAGVAYPSFYVADLDAAVAFYAALLGPPETADDAQFHGFPIGDDRLTLFSAPLGPHPDSGPRGSEFAIRTKRPEDVDAVYARLLELGARSVMAPEDTWMYRRMRFCCVDDPFGIRVDAFCPLPESD